MKWINTFFVEHWQLLSMLLILSITCLSLFPLPQLPEVPGNDKTLHLIAYAALAFPVSWASPKHLISILCFYILYSGALELIQPYVNRYGEWKDLLANSMGVFIGLGMGKLFSRLFRN